MDHSFENEVIAPQRLVRDDPKLGEKSVDAAGLKYLRAHEILFTEGSPKTHVYLIETGAICLYARPLDHEPAFLKRAMPGEFLGLGFLKTHLHSARALIASRVRIVPPDLLSALIANDPIVWEQQHVATEFEFAARRAALVALIPNNPLQRVASYLVAVAHANAREGHELGLIRDTLPCGVVAEYLDMTIDTLTRQLVELKTRKLIEDCGEGLELLNLPELEKLADLKSSRRPSQQTSSKPRPLQEILQKFFASKRV